MWFPQIFGQSPVFAARLGMIGFEFVTHSLAPAKEQVSYPCLALCKLETVPVLHGACLIAGIANDCASELGPYVKLSGYQPVIFLFLEVLT